MRIARIATTRGPRPVIAHCDDCALTNPVHSR